MGILVNGQWQQAPLAPNDKAGHFIRPASSFRHIITKDENSKFKAEPNRYHLYLSYACPWACRTLIFLSLKKLENIISFSFVEPLMLENGWEFGPLGSESQDPLNQSKYLYQIYQKADPNYTGKVTVPVLWDKHTKTIVNNESSEIIRMLNSEFNNFTENQYDYYPKELRKDIDEINDFIYINVNNGVYKCGFANSQTAYEEAFDSLFSALLKLELILSRQRYLVGVKITEADWRLFTTLIRFDVVYFSHFKCNLKRIEDYPSLSNYLRELYQIPEIKATVNFKQIKQHYYGSQRFINPTGIVPKGPEIHLDSHRNRENFMPLT